jgi:nitric oxide reductase subunit B
METVSEHLLGDEGPVSPWWLRIVGIVMVVGFALLFFITGLAYRNAPPIPDKVVDAQGTTLFTGEDVRSGQAVFLRYGLMDNGSIWGHGAYLGPDYAALALHRMGEDTARALSQAQHGRPPEQLDEMERAALQAQTAVVMKANRYDPATQTLQLTAPQTLAYQRQVGYWTDYFTASARNGGLKPDLITDPTELRQFTAFVAWAAWASVA